MKYDPIIFTLPESVDPERFIIGTYYVETDAPDLLTVSSALAVEQTTGTWVPVPGETPEVRRRHVGRVISIFELPDYEFDMGERKGRRQVGQSQPGREVFDQASVDTQVHKRGQQHIAGGAGKTIDINDFHREFLAIIAAAIAAPKPLSILTTTTPGEQEFSIPKSAARPLNEAP